MTDVKDTKTLTLEGALKVLNAAIAEATRIGQPMCIAVVDTGGNLLAFGRMDGSKGLSVTSSINKARTSALSGAPTGGAGGRKRSLLPLPNPSMPSSPIAAGRRAFPG